MENKDKWLLNRKGTLSGSQISPIVSHFVNELLKGGIINYEMASMLKEQSTYSSCYAIWRESNMDKESYLEWQSYNSNQYTSRGEKFEEIVFEKFLNNYPEYKQVEAGRHMHIIEDVKDEKGKIIGKISATLDYHLKDAIVECKTMNDYMWYTVNNEEPPISWILQLQMQMHLTGVDKGFLAVLIGKDEKGDFIQKEFKVFEILKDERKELAILEASKMYFTEYETKAPCKLGIKKEEEIEEFLRKKQEAINLDIEEENELQELIIRKHDLRGEIETVKKYLAEIEIESKKINSKITSLANLQKDLGGQIRICKENVLMATIEYKKDKDSLYTQNDIDAMKKIKVGDIKRKGFVRENFKIINEKQFYDKI